jgi:hypothetical protein
MPKSKGRRKPKRHVTPPPPPKEEKVSPPWYVALMATLIGLGLLTIILNYIDLVPGGQRSTYLYSGLGGIAVGFMMMLNYY